MDNETLKFLRAKAHTLHATVRVGRSGLTESIVKETKKQLNKKKLIKIKILNSVSKEKTRDEVEKMIMGLARKTCSKLIHKVGFTAVLYKE